MHIKNRPIGYDVNPTGLKLFPGNFSHTVTRSFDNGCLGMMQQSIQQGGVWLDVPNSRDWV